MILWYLFCRTPLQILKLLVEADMFSRLAQLAKGGFANPTYNILKRHMGRKSGTKFLEFPVRAPSKKQQKRRAKFMERLSSQRDPQKEAIRMSKMERQYSNPKIEEELKAMMAR